MRRRGGGVAGVAGAGRQGGRWARREERRVPASAAAAREARAGPLSGPTVCGARPWGAECGAGVGWGGGSRAGSRAPGSLVVGGVLTTGGCHPAGGPPAACCSLCQPRLAVLPGCRHCTHLLLPAPRPAALNRCRGNHFPIPPNRLPLVAVSYCADAYASPQGTLRLKNRSARGRKLIWNHFHTSNRTTAKTAAKARYQRRGEGRKTWKCRKKALPAWVSAAHWRGCCSAADLV